MILRKFLDFIHPAVALIRFKKIEIRRNLGLVNLNSLERLILLDGYKQVRNKEVHTIIWRGCPGRGAIHSESAIALGLKLRGINSKFIFLDESTTGCIDQDINKGLPLSQWGQISKKCYEFGTKSLKRVGLEYIDVGELVTKKKQLRFRQICNNLHEKELIAYQYKGVPVGKMAKDSTLSYLRGKSFKDQYQILRKYLFTALMCTEAARAALDRFKPKHLLMQRHLEYADWAPAYYVFTQAGLPATLWSTGATLDYRVSFKNVKGTDLTSFFAMSDKAWEERENQDLTKEEEKELMKLLGVPWRKGRLKRIPYKPQSIKAMKKKLGISNNKPIWCVFLHVNWDAGFNPDLMPFKDVVDWTWKTISIIKKIKNVNWLIKVHPSEQIDTVYGMEEVIREKFAKLPEHVKIIPADSKITTNDLIKILDGGVTLQGTVGVQLPAQGIPMIVGCKTHYAAKGFTYDAFRLKEYARLLEKAWQIKKLSQKKIKLARQYAYSLFFQRNLTLNMLEGRCCDHFIDLKQAYRLHPGNDEVFDFICEKIIKGGEFIL